MDNRNWRDAKIPQWVKDSIAAENRATELRAALSWPTESKPEPLPFRWGDYDILHGTPREGVFWSTSFDFERPSVSKIHIKENDGGNGYKKWAFSRDGEKWGTSVHRGHLFETERAARLWLLWAACENYAAKLVNIRLGLK